MTPDEVIAAVIEAHEGRIGTHYEGCWKYHAGCLATFLREMYREDEMTPAEVIVMRDKLTWEMVLAFAEGSFRMHNDAQELSDWLIETGWVVASPKGEATCTCPTGDGSLRWPCKVHPPKSEGESE